MLGQSLKTVIRTTKTEDIELVYNLHFRNTLYSIECYKDGCTNDNPINYYLLEDITDDEGEAEDLLNILAKGKVFPIHIKEIVEDILHF